MANGSMITAAPGPHEDSQFLRGSHVLGKSGFQKRIDKLIATKYQADAKIRELEEETASSRAENEAQRQEILRLEAANLRLLALVGQYKQVLRTTKGVAIGQQ
jgi:hypothetical protein